MTGIIVLAFRVFGIVCLYVFVGWAVLTIWRDLKLASSNLSRQQFPTLNITQADLDVQGGNDFRTSEVIIGRDEGCDYRIPDETISSRHTRLSYHHSQWWVEDLQSTNGTYLNDERIYTSTVVISGDDLRCGKVNLKIIIKAD